MKIVTVKLSNNSYDVVIGSGLLAQAGARLKELGFSGKAVIVTDSKVRGLYAGKLKQDLEDSGFQTLLIELPQGEEQKSLDTAASLYEKLTDFYAERNTPLLALGGGVIGDLTGFVAATYMRGVPLIQIPTTLLSQGDSSIGGKTAVNHGRMKNKVGAFYHPRLTISDVNVLKTLSERELSDGLSEIIKHGIILDSEFFSYLETNLSGIKARDEKVLEKAVSRSALIKAGVVEKDELDLGLRNILNFGHTVGHAIESVSELKIWHGEAVAIGMLVEASISYKMGKLDGKELERMEKVITGAGLPARIPSLPVPEMLRAMLHDKKNSQGKIKFILPEQIGKVFITDEVSPSLIEEVLRDRNE
jgi:3-dehydroquinate synthase